MIYYFQSLRFTIHDTSKKTTCPTRPYHSKNNNNNNRSSNLFRKNPTSISKTRYSSQINLFLTSRNIIHTAHPIWLTTSTFSFGACVTGGPTVVLYRMPVSREWMAAIRSFEGDTTSALALIEVLGVWRGGLESWGRRERMCRFW